jgi:hypothetical protein
VMISFNERIWKLCSCSHLICQANVLVEIEITDLRSFIA